MCTNEEEAMSFWMGFKYKARNRLDRAIYNLANVAVRDWYKQPQKSNNLFVCDWLNRGITIEKAFDLLGSFCVWFA